MTLPHTALQFLVLLYFIIVQQAGAAVVFGIIPAEKTPAPGITVSHVHPGTPAHLAGLQAGDTITRINNTHIDTTATLRKVLAAQSPGSIIRIYYQRNSKQRAAIATLQPLPESTQKKTFHAESPVLSAEQRLQFAQARTRLRLQLARLPHRMNREQVLADMRELLVLARSIPATHSQWLQGSTVDMQLELPDAAGRVVLRMQGEQLWLEFLNTRGSCEYQAAIDTPAQRAALPATVQQRLHQLLEIR